MALTESNRQRPFRPKRWMIVAAVVAIGWVAQQAGIDLSELGLGAPNGGAIRPSEPASQGSRLPAPGRDGPAAAPRGSISEASARIERAVEERRSGFMITVDARVLKTLRDDNEGSRHQRFLIELDTGRTLLVAHNIDLADRVPLGRGDPVRIRGQYEWNDKGGVLHWTHHDPDGSHEGGWIEYRGRRTE